MAIGFKLHGYVRSTLNAVYYTANAVSFEFNALFFLEKARKRKQSRTKPNAKRQQTNQKCIG